MITKVLIDIDENRYPVIKLTGLRSSEGFDDVKDKLVRGFAETMSGRLAVLQYPSHAEGNEAIVKAASLDCVLSWLGEMFPEGSPNWELVQKIRDNEFGETSAVF